MNVRDIDTIITFALLKNVKVHIVVDRFDGVFPEPLSEFPDRNWKGVGYCYFMRSAPHPTYWLRLGASGKSRLMDEIVKAISPDGAASSGGDRPEFYVIDFDRGQYITITVN